MFSLCTRDLSFFTFFRPAFVEAETDGDLTTDGGVAGALGCGSDLTADEGVTGASVCGSGEGVALGGVGGGVPLNSSKFPNL